MTFQLFPTLAVAHQTSSSSRLGHILWENSAFIFHNIVMDMKHINKADTH